MPDTEMQSIRPIPADDQLAIANALALDSDLDSSDSDDSHDAEAVESLVAGRARRVNAGNRMGTLVEQEADEEDVVNLLFADQEELDEGDYELGGDSDSDVAMDSSSSDEDQGPDVKGDEEFEGERELERQAKAENKKAQKRKGLDPFAQASSVLRQKRAKTEQQSTNAISANAEAFGPRQRKKSERVSWLPINDDEPVRQSSRRQTVQNKVATHERLKHSEGKKRQIIEAMEAAKKRKQLENPKKKLTQADRIAEAEKTERRNIKSLNRWEDMEKRRAEEQAAKLAALQNRCLEGPVLTWWSGLATWVDGQMVKVGKINIQSHEEKVARKKKLEESVDNSNTPPNVPKQLEAGDGIASTAENISSEAHSKPTDAVLIEPQASADLPTTLPANFDGLKEGVLDVSSDTVEAVSTHGQQSSDIPPDQAKTLDREEHSNQPVTTSREDAHPYIVGSAKEEGNSTASAGPSAISNVQQDAVEPPNQSPTRFLTGLHQYANILASEDTTAATATAQSNSESVYEVRANERIETPTAIESIPLTTSSGDNIPSSSAPVVAQDSAVVTALDADDKESLDRLTAPSRPASKEISSRTIAILTDFDALSAAEKSPYSIFFNKPPGRPVRSSKASKQSAPVPCPLTGLPTRYRDPGTNLSYGSAQAYREIRSTLEGKYAWSPLLECYIGAPGWAAKGVPKRFVDPMAERSVPKVKAQEGVGPMPIADTVSNAAPVTAPNANPQPIALNPMQDSQKLPGSSASADTGAPAPTVYSPAQPAPGIPSAPQTQTTLSLPSMISASTTNSNLQSVPSGGSPASRPTNTTIKSQVNATAQVLPTPLQQPASTVHNKMQSESLEAIRDSAGPLLPPDTRPHNQVTQAIALPEPPVMSSSDNTDSDLVMAEVGEKPT